MFFKYQLIYLENKGILREKEWTHTFVTVDYFICDNLLLKMGINKNVLALNSEIVNHISRLPLHFSRCRKICMFMDFFLLKIKHFGNLTNPISSFFLVINPTFFSNHSLDFPLVNYIPYEIFLCYHIFLTL